MTCCCERLTECASWSMLIAICTCSARLQVRVPDVEQSQARSMSRRNSSQMRAGQQDDTDEPLMRPVTRREFAAALLQLDGEAKLPNTLPQALRPTTVGSVQKLELKTPAGEQSCLAEIKHSGQICEALDVFNAVQAVVGSSKVRCIALPCQHRGIFDVLQAMVRACV